MDSGSFSMTLAKLESQAQKLNMSLRNTRYMYETGNMALTYEIAMRTADVAERIVLLARALPAYTGNPMAAMEVQNLIDISIRVEVGFTDQGWFCVRMPLLLPKKESGSADYVRSFLYPAMNDFFRNKAPVRYEDCVLAYRHVYAKDRPERQKRDHDNIEINMVSDIVALYVLTDDAPSLCRHYYCSAAAKEERTEVYVIPYSDFPLWLDIEKSMPEEGVTLCEQRPEPPKKICEIGLSEGRKNHSRSDTVKEPGNQGFFGKSAGADSDKESSPVVGGSQPSGV